MRFGDVHGKSATLPGEFHGEMSPFLLARRLVGLTEQFREEETTKKSWTGSSNSSVIEPRSA